MMNLSEFAHRMPKVELHVHLEGSIQPETLLILSERNGVRLPASDERGLRAFYHFRDFDHFIQVYKSITNCLKSPDDYRLVAYEFGRQAARQNVRYAEVTFSILTNVHLSGLPWQAILESLNDGRRQAQAEFNVDWRWVFDIVRNHPEVQLQVAEIALQAQDAGVVALGLGGSEAEFPPGLFVNAFALARSRGLKGVPHAGEHAGPSSVWAAINELGADRIGHGARSSEDARLVAVLRERQIPLELCPTSNICLKVYPDYGAHPLRRLWQAGVLVTVNSDDPPLFDTELNREYQVLIEHFGFTADELEQVSLNGLRASFLPKEEAARLQIEFQKEFARLRSTGG